MNPLLKIIANLLVPNLSLKGLAEDAARQRIRDELTRKLSKGVRAVAAKLDTDAYKPGVTTADDKKMIRSALYWHFRQAAPGEIADRLRDVYDDKVVEIVLPRMSTKVTLTQVAQWTADALIEVIF
jgi:hypothetical protein